MITGEQIVGTVELNGRRELVDVKSDFVLSRIRKGQFGHKRNTAHKSLR